MLLWLERRACKHRGCEASLNHLGWGRVLGCYLGSCFSGFVLLVVLWGSFFWFVLFGRSSRGSCFWVRSLGSSFGGSCVFFFDAFKVLEGVCGKVIGFLCKDSKKFATMQIYTLKIFCSPFGFSVNRVVKAITTGGYGCLCGARKMLFVFRVLYFICNTFTACSIEGSTKFAALFRKRQTTPCVNVVIKVISH